MKYVVQRLTRLHIERIIFETRCYVKTRAGGELFKFIQECPAPFCACCRISTPVTTSPTTLFLCAICVITWQQFLFRTFERKQRAIIRHGQNKTRSYLCFIHSTYIMRIISNAAWQVAAYFLPCSMWQSARYRGVERNLKLKLNKPYKHHYKIISYGRGLTL